MSGEFLNKHRLAFKLVLLLLLAFNIDVEADADDDDTDKLNFRSNESCVSSLINARVVFTSFSSSINLKSSSSLSDSLSDETDDDGEDEDEEKSSSKLCKYFSLINRGRSLFC